MKKIDKSELTEGEIYLVRWFDFQQFDAIKIKKIEHPFISYTSYHFGRPKDFNEIDNIQAVYMPSKEFIESLQFRQKIIGRRRNPTFAEIETSDGVDKATTQAMS